jgi:hypothetical protein
MLFYACNKPGTMVHCFTYETERIDSMPLSRVWRKGKEQMSTEYIWETFDSLFKTVHRQGRRVEELEARLAELESRLQERPVGAAAAPPAPSQPSRKPEQFVTELPAERAA